MTAPRIHHLMVAIGAFSSASFACELTVTVDFGASPASGAGVVAQLVDDAGYSRDIDLTGSGDVVFRDAPCTSATLTVGCRVRLPSRNGIAPLQTARLQIGPDERWRLDLAELGLVQLATIDANENPAPFVDVALYSPAQPDKTARLLVVRTDEFGEAVLPAFPGRYTLRTPSYNLTQIFEGGQRQESTEFMVRSGAQQVVRVQVSHQELIRLEVSNTEGGAAADVVVDVDSQGAGNDCIQCGRTDGQGILNLPVRSFPVSLRLRDPSGQFDVIPPTFELDANPDRPLKAALRPATGSPLDVEVVDDKGKYIVGASVQIHFASRSEAGATGSRIATSDDHGIARLSVPDSKLIEMVVSPPQGASLAGVRQLVPSGPAPSRLRVVLQSHDTILVKASVSNPDRSPAIGVELTLVGLDGKGTPARSDDRGELTVSVDHPGTYRFIVLSPIAWNGQSLRVVSRLEGRRQFAPEIRVTRPSSKSEQPVRLRLDPGIQVCAELRFAAAAEVGPVVLELFPDDSDRPVASVRRALSANENALCTPHVSPGRFHVLIAPDSEVGRFAAVWWPNAPTRAAASTLTLRSGEATDRLTFLLRPVGALSLGRAPIAALSSEFTIWLCKQMQATQSANADPVCERWPTELLHERSRMNPADLLMTGVPVGPARARLCRDALCIETDDVDVVGGQARRAEFESLDCTEETLMYVRAFLHLNSEPDTTSGWPSAVFGDRALNGVEALGLNAAGKAEEVRRLVEFDYLVHRTEYALRVKLAQRHREQEAHSTSDQEQLWHEFLDDSRYLERLCRVAPAASSTKRDRSTNLSEALSLALRLESTLPEGCRGAGCLPDLRSSSPALDIEDPLLGADLIDSVTNDRSVNLAERVINGLEARGWAIRRD